MKNGICWNLSVCKRENYTYTMKIQICFDFFTCKSSLEYSVSMSKLIICTYMALPTQRRIKTSFFIDTESTKLHLP